MIPFLTFIKHLLNLGLWKEVTRGRVVKRETHSCDLALSLVNQTKESKNEIR